MTPKEQIIGLLPKLNPRELAEVRNAVKMLGQCEAAPEAPDLISDWVLSGIITFLIRKGLIAERGAHLEMKRRDAYKTYIRKLPPIISFLAKLQDQAQIGKRQQPQLGFLCATALADLLEKRGYFSVSAMISQIDKLPEALEEAYPGWIGGGLFGMIVKAEKNA